MEITKTEIQKMLTDFRDDVKSVIDETSKTQSDAANEKIKNLEEKLVAVDKALEDLKTASEKSFGLPGVEKEKDRWSWGKFMKGLYNDARVPRGLCSAGEAKRYWDNEASFEQAVCRDYNADNGADGGFLVPPQIYQGDIIDTVYANTAVLKMPVLRLDGLTSDIPIPVDEGNLTAYHVGENEAPTATSSSFGLKWLREKQIGVFCKVSEKLLRSSNRAVDSIIKNKMSRDASVELNRGLTNGVGANKEPRGILQYYSSMTGTANLATNGRRFTIDDLASMKMSLAAANELTDANTYGAIMHPSVLFGMIREKALTYSGQPARDGFPKIPSLLIDQTAIESALKMKIEGTTQIAAGTVGTSTTCTKVIAGDWSKFIVGMFGDLKFKVSDVAADGSGGSAFLQNQLYMVVFLGYDCVCVRPTAFTGRDGAEITETSW